MNRNNIGFFGESLSSMCLRRQANMKNLSKICGQRWSNEVEDHQVLQ
jgi:hypothetical protein